MARRDLQWHDHRMHWMSQSLPPQVTDKSRSTKVFDYAIPLRVGNRPGRIQVFRGSRELAPRTSGLKPGNKAILRAVFSTTLPKGAYRVAWRALADDGHHESGSWTFRVN